MGYHYDFLALYGIATMQQAICVHRTESQAILKMQFDLKICTKNT